MIDRSQAPKPAPPQVISFPDYEVKYLSNGLPVYVVQYGQAPICEIVLGYSMGRTMGEKSGIESIMLEMLREGTESFDANTIADLIDYYGCFISENANIENSSISMSFLTHKANDVMPLFGEIINKPTFPEFELSVLKNRYVQYLKVEETKTTYKARREFAINLFGKHPVTNILDTNLVNTIEKKDIVYLYDIIMNKQLHYCIVVGNFDEEIILELLEKEFGKKNYVQNNRINFPELPNFAKQGLVKIEMPDKLQSTIYTGHSFPNRYDSNYNKIRFVNMLLGGYFGSRLMKNIREDKGYTYGINSTYVPLICGGLFQISTDVANEFVDNTLKEIKHEIECLQNELIGTEELETAKNYYLGRVAGSIETPGDIADYLRSYISYNLSTAEFKNAQEVTLNITPNDVMAIAQQYYHVDKLLSVVAGA